MFLIRHLLKYLAFFPICCISKQVDYRLNINKSLEDIVVTICQNETFHTTFESSLSQATRFIKEHSANVSIQNERIELKQTSPPCFWLKIDTNKYRTDTQSVSNRANKFDSAKIIKLDTGLYFWRPITRATEHNYSLSLELPVDYSAALPWPINSKGAYELNTTPSFMSLDSYFGHFDNRKAKLDDAELNVAFLSNISDENQSKIVRWLTLVCRALRATNETLPFKQLQIIITDVKQQTFSATPFAMVYRGEGTLVHFWVYSNADESDFIGDWTAYHEFAHLLLPFVDRREAWVSEGFASYQQYLLMARVGLLKEKETFERLWGGIQRGKQNYSSTQGIPLHKASRHMRDNHSYRRVYWTGALTWLEADIALRRQNKTLLQVLRQFNQCCVNQHAIWSAEELARSLDQLVKQPVFTPLFRRVKYSRGFPDYSPLFSQLGINVIGNRLSFEHSRLRQSIISHP